MASSPEPTPSQVAAAVPDYEVKLFLDPEKVLDVEFKPTREVRQLLNLSENSLKITMQFLDARPVQLQATGWTVRARKFEKANEIELTYKRRYPVGAATLTDALAAASRDGFHAGEDDYAAQVEWGYQAETLSFSRKRAFAATGGGETTLPSLADLQRAAVAGLPGKLDRWQETGWARGVLAAGQTYGPVLGKRWSGEWQGPALDLEVWLIKAETGPGYEPVVELSFKEKKEKKASGFRDKLKDFIRDSQWLLERDVLKTAMIFRRY